jgi:hypothetical protein
MLNPYFELHKEFSAAGAKVLMSSGQACVLLGIAAFSKDGDWIIRESEDSCRIVLKILESKKASYRMGMPLDIRFLRYGWTAHFEYHTKDDYRMRVDFCSRPPRVENIEEVWRNCGIKNNIEFVDVENLIRLKQTRRVRDYHIIGTLAQVLGFQQNQPAIALMYLQDFSLLEKAVRRWLSESGTCDRQAVKLLVAGAERAAVIAALAVEQDEKMQADEARVRRLVQGSKGFLQIFTQLKQSWTLSKRPLFEQHEDLLRAALPALEHL